MLCPRWVALGHPIGTLLACLWGNFTVFIYLSSAHYVTHLAFNYFTNLVPFSDDVSLSYVLIRTPAPRATLPSFVRAVDSRRHQKSNC